jgi:adenosylhomocysteinase
LPGTIADVRLAEKGKKSFEWASGRMSIVGKLVSEYRKSRPLAGVRLGLCLHITRETAVLAMAAKSLGAKVALCSANPLSAQDDIAAFLYSRGVSVFAWRGETKREYERCIRSVVDFRPDIVTDDGGDLHAACHKAGAGQILGGTEETTSGVSRLRAMQDGGRLAYPVIAVNNAMTKHLFDNRYGTGQSTLDGILRATSVLIAGKQVVVCGYGWVGRGVASRARGMGASVTVTEVDPVRALEAKMDGFAVERMSQAATHGDIFITCTGQSGVIRKEHFWKMKDGAMLANAGHFDVEIDASYLYLEHKPAVEVRPGVEQFTVNKKKLYLLSKGRVANLVLADGNSPEVMALSFANQLLSIIHIARNHSKMEKRIYEVPPAIDAKIAGYALAAMGLEIDRLTPHQKRYRDSSIS